MKRLVIVFLGLTFIFSSCGSGGNEQGEENPFKAQDDKPVLEASVVSQDPMENKGVGPVSSIELTEEIDSELAAKGQEIFESKCAACHKFDKKYVGPAVGGVTERRSPEWIANMILNPEEMTKKDPIAKELLAEHLTQMTFQNVTEDDARAILEYFRQVDAE